MFDLKWTRMEDGTKQDFEHLMAVEQEYNEGVVDRILDMLKQL